MKKTSDCYAKKPSCCGGFGFASLLIIGGGLLLCTKLNLIPAKYIDSIISWQMLLIIIGIVSLVKKQVYTAAFFLSLGSFFIIPKIGLVPDNFLGSVPPNFIQLYWPVLLIIAGVFVVIHNIFSPNKARTIREKILYEAEKSGMENQYNCENGFINKRSVFESGKHIVLEPEFKGGIIKTVFGETKLDLRKTSLPEGITTLEIDIAFGSVIILIPENWRIKTNTNTVFGAFEDKRSYFNDDSESTKTLVISGSIIFGEGVLKN